MEVSLKVTKPKGGSKTYRVSKPEVVVGRGKDCDMQILSTEVSRRHCRFTIGEDSVTVQDLGSANGTNVDGMPVQAQKEIPLTTGALVEIGPLKISVRFTPPVAELDGSSTMPAAQDGTVHNEGGATADAGPASGTDPARPPVDEETLEEVAPVVPSAIADSHDDLDPEALETHEELDGSVQFDMTAVDEDEPLEAVEPADDGVETAIAEPVAEAFAEAEAPAEPVVEEKKAGGLKSLFGMLGRGKKTAEDTVDEFPEPVATSEPATEVAPDIAAPDATEAEIPAGAIVSDSQVAPSEDVDDIDEAELDELLEDLDEDELEALLADEETETTGQPAANPAPQAPADPGLNDFLNQIGQGDS